VPLYEYQCKQCGRRVEKIQMLRDEPLRTCEVCGGELERLISRPAIQFKGTGWYVTDYARRSGSSSNNGKSESASGDSKAEKSDSPKSETKTDSKPDKSD
jgi:putative FmdB family regulatory protein